MGPANTDAVKGFAPGGVSSSSTGHGHHLRTYTSLPSDLATFNLELVGYFRPSGLSELTLPYVQPENVRARKTEEVLRAHLSEREHRERPREHRQGAGRTGGYFRAGTQTQASGLLGPGDGPLAHGSGHHFPLIRHSGRFQSTFTHKHSSAPHCHVVIEITVLFCGWGI